MRHLEISDIPAGAAIAIYGNGAAGHAVLGRIRSERADIIVIGFLDSFHEDPTSAPPVLHRNSLPEIEDDLDLILIASAWWPQIAADLSEMGFDKHAVAALSLWHKYVFSASEMDNAAPAFRRVRSMLQSEEDRRLYDFLTEARRTGTDAIVMTKGHPRIPDETLDSPIFAHLGKQYQDFINKNAIRTVLHAGVYDGLDCVRFIKRLPHLDHVYGFDLQGDDALQPVHREFIERSGKATILRKGLWNTTGTMNCSLDGSSSSLVNRTEMAAGAMTIDTIDIDAFATEYRTTVDYICLDIEGAEWEALEGARNTILRDRPQLAVCIYHKKHDIHELPIYLNDLLENYIYRLGHYADHLHETVLYCIPEELAD